MAVSVAVAVAVVVTGQAGGRLSCSSASSVYLEAPELLFRDVWTPGTWSLYNVMLPLRRLAGVLFRACLVILNECGRDP